tara:strand:- start:1016 stop:2530 length:1515 start_codon:yes stop_codon:yes gene_type:complete
MNNNKSKIISTEKLKKIKIKNKKIILCHGVFDVLHYGHLNHFEFAKKKAQHLVVSVTTDKFVNKGPNRPINNINHRIRMLSNLSIVDNIVCSDSSSAVEIIKLLKPNFYLKGEEYLNKKNDIAGNLNKEKLACKGNNVKMIYSYGPVSSSSEIINKSSLGYSKTKRFLSILRKKLSNDKVKEMFKIINSKKILVIGETIIDRYLFSEVVGKSGKEPMLVLTEKSKKDYIGGAASIAKQVSSLCEKTSFLSCLGENKNYLKTINNYLGNVKAKYIFKSNSPTILKTRYVDETSNTKMLGVYKINDIQLNKPNENQTLNFLKNKINKYDLVIVSDYGHGFLTKKISKLISTKSKKLSVNCQINANNNGLHSIQKYRNPDCVLINESEMRNEMRDRYSDSKILIKKLSSHLKAKNVIVTQGTEGALFYQRKTNKTIRVPAFGKIVKDKVGAGDLFLAVFSIFSLVSKEKDFALYAGSLSAAEAIKDFGNTKILSKKNLENQVLYNLK